MRGVGWAEVEGIRFMLFFVKEEDGFGSEEIDASLFCSLSRKWLTSLRGTLCW